MKQLVSMNRLVKAAIECEKIRLFVLATFKQIQREEESL